MKNILSNAIKWGKYIIKIHSLHYHQISKCGHELQQSEKGNMCLLDYLFDGTKRVKNQTDGSAGKWKHLMPSRESRDWTLWPTRWWRNQFHQLSSDNAPPHAWTCTHAHIHTHHHTCIHIKYKKKYSHGWVFITQHAAHIDSQWSLHWGSNSQ